MHGILFLWRILMIVFMDLKFKLYLMVLWFMDFIFKKLILKKKWIDLGRVSARWKIFLSTLSDLVRVGVGW
jgi:hypothetical protein